MDLDSSAPFEQKHVVRMVCRYIFASHNQHRFTGTIAEIAYYKGTQIDNTERDACKDYMVEKFGI